MLVSAAIEPYTKSYGKARSNSAIATGSRSSDRITASPRKTCVPGVHAYAADGSNTSAAPASSTMTARSRGRANRCSRFASRPLDPQPLPLSPQGTTEIAQLGLDHVIDRLLRLAEVVLHVIANLVARNALPQIAARVACPRGAASTDSSRPHARPLCALGGAAQHRRKRPASGWAATHQQRRPHTDRDTDQRCRQQIVLLLSCSAIVAQARDRLLVLPCPSESANGAAVARHRPRTPWRRCRSHRTSPPQYRFRYPAPADPGRRRPVSQTPSHRPHPRAPTRSCVPLAPLTRWRRTSAQPLPARPAEAH